MTEQIKSAIEQIQTEMIKDIDIPKSAKTELANQKALHLAIRSLQAWEEVLNELEILIRGCNIMLEDNDEDMFYGGKKRAYEKVIEVINQHLAEIEE